MDYSQETQNLIDRMCINVERLDFTLDKKNAEETILKTYDLFGLNRPKKIKWHKDIFTKEYQEVCESAWSAGSARSAGSAWSAWSAGSAGSALDYDFDWFIFEYEYCKNPDKDLLPNDNDRIYLDHCELLMQAKEYGLGYRVEWEDTLHLVQTPLVKINASNIWHSDEVPAIRWKGGEEFFYLNGVNFPEKLWKKITGRKMTLKNVMAIEDIDQRTQAMNYIPVAEFLEHAGGEILDTCKKGEIEYKLYQLPQGIFTEVSYFAVYNCPSTDKLYMSGIEPSIGSKKNIVTAMAWKANMTEKDWLAMELLVHES